MPSASRRRNSRWHQSRSIGLAGQHAAASSQGKSPILNLSLGEYIERAYGIKHYQIVGPDWVVNYRSENRYDVMAKAASAVPTEELLRMFAPLLAERFRLAVHRETRAFPVYVLVVDKGG